MGCNSDYLNPTYAEKNSREVAQHIIFVYNQLGKKVPEEYIQAANHVYGNISLLDQMVVLLCKELRELTPDIFDAVVYNGKNKQSRRLADWWEEHKLADKIREEAEQQVRKSALAKLTDIEKKVLGLSEE